MKGYTVFNAEQVDGLPAHFYAMQQATLDPVARIERAEVFFAATGARSRRKSARAVSAATFRPASCAIR
jgi:antirestriction protein ArdC